MPACVEDLDTRAPRGLDPAQFVQVIELGWIRERLNVLITDPAAVGKSYLGAALAHAACRTDFSVRCFRLPRLIEELARYGAMQKPSALFRQLPRTDVLVLDHCGFAPLADQPVRDLLEILDDRYDRRSTLITSQLPIDQWHGLPRRSHRHRHDPRSTGVQRLSPGTKGRVDTPRWNRSSRIARWNSASASAPD